MHHRPLCRPPVLSTQPATGTLYPAWHHRLLAWALGLAALLMLLPGWATAQTGTWSTTNPMDTARYEHTATLLPSGKVLVAGGYNGRSTLASAKLYDPDTHTWSTTGSMDTARNQHTATLLSSGKVLVAGGYNINGTLASAELYDPDANTWSSTGSMGYERYEHTATLLPSGKVLVAGGYINGTLASAELYDPATNTWSNTTNPMVAARRNHTATLLPSGKVLVAGGYNINGTLASAELYDPDANTWSSTGSMGYERSAHTATLLPSGKVLVAGGVGSGFLASAELYDPDTHTWSTTGSMDAARRKHTATLLSSGKVLVAGGRNINGALANAALYDPGVPGVTAISPPNGPTLGGTPVTLTGTQFTGATSATVCGVALTGLAVVNDTTLTGTTPAHAATATACNVVVTTAFGTGTGTALFSYAKSSQTLAFGSAPALVVGVLPLGTLSATSSAASLDGLTTFSSLTSSICTVAGSSVSAVAAGTCTVAADNPGNGDYDAALQVTQTITVAPAPIRSATGTPPGASPITASFTGGTATCGFESAQFPSATAVGGTLPAGLSFAQGAFGFTTTQCGKGAALTLTLTFDQPLAANTQLFKFNGSTWVGFPASISGNTVTYQVTDGGAGDSNPVEGVITDPVAVGAPLLAAVVPTPVPTLGQWALVLLSLMAAALGAGALRRNGGKF